MTISEPGVHGDVETPAEAPRTGPVLCEDGLWRCPWAATDPLLRSYHDSEWGVPLHGERELFERICLEGFQAGLSWLTVLRKRPAFRAAFADFDPDAVARLSDADVDAMLANKAIIRNRAKIQAARTNARAVLALRADGGLDALLWSHADPEAFAPRVAEDIPSRSEPSVRLAGELKGRGFRFVGPTTVLALMEACGMVNTHLLGCHRRDAAQADRAYNDG